MTVNDCRLPSFRRNSTVAIRWSPRDAIASTRSSSSRAREYAEHFAQPLELRRRLVAEQSGERQIRRADRPAGPDEAQPGG